jgi:hypothetical protein
MLRCLREEAKKRGGVLEGVTPWTAIKLWSRARAGLLQRGLVHSTALMRCLSGHAPRSMNLVLPEHRYKYTRAENTGIDRVSWAGHRLNPGLRSSTHFTSRLHPPASG